jgi:RhoGEF domain
VWKFQKPLMAAASVGKEVIPIPDVRSIVSNVEIILNFNSLMLEALADRMQHWEEEGGDCLGDVFLSFSDYLRSYVSYVNNYGNAMQTIARCKYVCFVCFALFVCCGLIVLVGCVCVCCFCLEVAFCWSLLSVCSIESWTVRL